ncbi:MAG: class D sortase [Candidatus Solibacter sp.]
MQLALTIVDRTMLGVGLILLAVFAGDVVYQSVSSAQDVREFDAARTAAASESPQPPPGFELEGPADLRLWSAPRARAYHESGAMRKAAPIAVVRIERLNVRVPVYEGTDGLTLNRGAGWIAGTARPGERGNIGIAGHRDGFFRPLKDAVAGDSIELLTLRETTQYRVDQIEIVTPENTGVLETRATPSLTLVTCYPFYFIGDAPKRYILHASLNGRTTETQTTRRAAK